MSGFFSIEFRTAASLHPDREPSQFISEHRGVIHYESLKDGKVSRVGLVRAYRIHAGLAADAGESLFDVCDSHSGELQEVHALLYEPDGHVMCDAVANAFSAYEPDVLVLDYVILHPKWRGLRLGLLAVRRTVDLLGCGCGLTISRIAPLNHEAAPELGVPDRWLPMNGSPEARRNATVKLRRYAREMGFVRLGRSPYYVLPMNMVTPSAHELIRTSRGPSSRP